MRLEKKPLELKFDAVWSGSELVAGAKLYVGNGKIVQRTRISPPGNGRVALPAFANAHVHLELSGIEGESLPRSDFASWVKALVPRKDALNAEELKQSIRSGVRSLLRSGTVAVGDIDSCGLSAGVLSQTPMAGIVFYEMLGEWSEERWRAFVSKLENRDRSDRIRVGVCPHAPYSTAFELFRQLARYAESQGLPLASHIAETLEEREFLESDAGPLKRLFQEWGVAKPAWPGSPPSLLAADSQFARLLFIHGNYLRETEIEQVVQQRRPLIYCPRSHDYFDHPSPHPAGMLLRRGIPVALGTDSRASNWGLDMWQEMSCFRRKDPAVADLEIWLSATRMSRTLLCMGPADLEVGDEATFQVVETQRPSRDILAAAVRGELRTVQTWVAGNKLSAETPANTELS